MSRRVGSPKAEVMAVTTEANSVDERPEPSGVGVADATPVLYLRA